MLIKAIKLSLMIFVLISPNELSFIQSSTLTRWPTNTIPFAFSDRVDFDSASRNKIEIALRELERLLIVDGQTCIKFVPRVFEEDYVLFVNKGEF